MDKSILIFLLAAIGITHIIVGSSIFGPIRKILLNYSGKTSL